MCSRILFVASFAIVSLASAGPASFIKKCTSGDGKCTKESAAAAIPAFAEGIPELGVKPLDPYFFKHLDASSGSLKLILKDVTIKGLKGCKPKKMQRDLSTSRLAVKLICDITADGQYDMSGRLLVLPIEGKGKMHIELPKLVISADVLLADKEGADGKKHWSIKDWSHSYDLKEKSVVQFDNLFPGNELLGRAARELVATSSNEIVVEVGPPIIRTMAAKIVEQVGKFFDSVPVDELVN
ncbi:hypothetical protein JYU34_017597 [Plutella xylostella]|uniref:Uncharacterized protein n=3 Tax=Plutella xylostella TaxID=51655 RepID=A0ABQ7Q1K3_PLUXY|nr:hypothetical protein JYU34_017597 [Plutella xylostella]CAG9134956.1 unnamed protein product [Plutella xylostella]